MKVYNLSIIFILNIFLAASTLLFFYINHSFYSETSFLDKESFVQTLGIYWPIFLTSLITIVFLFRGARISFWFQLFLTLEVFLFNTFFLVKNFSEILLAFNVFFFVVAVGYLIWLKFELGKVFYFMKNFEGQLYQDFANCISFKHSEIVKDKKSGEPWSGTWIAWDNYGAIVQGEKFGKVLVSKGPTAAKLEGVGLEKSIDVELVFLNKKSGMLGVRFVNKKKEHISNILIKLGLEPLNLV